MVRIISFLITAIIIAVSKGFAQLPSDFRTEHVFMSSDYYNYTSEDTIHINGVVTSLAHMHSKPYSRIVYTELIDPRLDSVMVRNTVTCDENGMFHTCFIPDQALDNGDYYIRAYTAFMRNFAPEAFAFRHIRLNMPLVSDDGVIDLDINCTILPANRVLLANVPQQIIAALVNHQGIPLAGQRLTMLNDKGDTIGVRNTSAAGYAVFNFIPSTTESYNLVYDNMGIRKNFPLPHISTDSPQIAATLKGSNIKFAVHNCNAINTRMFVFDTYNGLNEITAADGHGSINLPNRLQGPVTLFMTDDKLNIITQTSLLPRLDTSLKLDMADTLSAGKRLEFKIDGLTSGEYTAMCRFAPISDPLPTSAEIDLIASDFYSPLPLPMKSVGTEAAYADMQAWLSTATFRRFELRELIEKDSEVYKFLPERNLTISGTVYDDENAKHPMKHGRILAYNARTRMISDTTVSDKGRFTIDVDDFKNGTEFFLQATNSKGVMIRGCIKPDDDSYPAVGVLPAIRHARSHNRSTDISVGQPRADSRKLPDVTVKARVIRHEKRNDKKFYKNRYIDREVIEKYNYVNVMQMLRSFPFIRVWLVCEKEDDLSDAYYAIQTLNGTMVPLIVDGTPVEIKTSQYIFDIPATDIESIEQLTPSEALMYLSSLTGGIHIQTRKPGPPPPKDSKGTRLWPSGLTSDEHTYGFQQTAPTQPNDYRLTVDIITGDGQVKSFVRNVTVVI